MTMMASKLKLIKLLLLLVVPTVFSVDAVMTGCQSQLLGLSAPLSLSYSVSTPRLDEVLDCLLPGGPAGPGSPPLAPGEEG